MTAGERQDPDAGGAGWRRSSSPRTGMRSLTNRRSGQHLSDESDAVPVDVQRPTGGALERHRVGVVAPYGVDDVLLVLGDEDLAASVEDDPSGQACLLCRV